MDLTKVLWALGAFTLGLCIGGVVEIGTLVVVACILFGVYYVSVSVFNAVGGVREDVESLKRTLDQPKDEEQRTPIGFQSNLVEINEE